MFGKSKEIAGLRKEVGELKLIIKNFKEAPLKNMSVETRLSEEKRRKECNEADICYICGEALKRVDTDPDDQNLPEFSHRCPEHGEMWVEYW